MAGWARARWIVGWIISLGAVFLAIGVTAFWVRSQWVPDGLSVARGRLYFAVCERNDSGRGRAQVDFGWRTGCGDVQGRWLAPPDPDAEIPYADHWIFQYVHTDVRAPQLRWFGSYREQITSSGSGSSKLFCQSQTIGYVGCWVVLWALLPAVLIPAPGILRRRRKRRWRRQMRCERCGYDLRATPRRCPECGAEREG